MCSSYVNMPVLFYRKPEMHYWHGCILLAFNLVKKSCEYVWIKTFVKSS